MNTQENTVPTEVDFNNSDVVRSLSRPQLREGWMKFRVVNMKPNSAASTGTLMQTLIVAPVDEHDRPVRQTLDHRIYMPFANSGVAEHKAPNTIGFCESYLQSTNPKVFERYPRKVPTGYETIHGEVLTFGDAEAYKKGLRNKTFTEMQARWKDNQRYLGEEFFGLVKYEAGGQDPAKKFPKIVKLRSEAPTDAEVIESDFTAVDDESEAA